MAEERVGPGKPVPGARIESGYSGGNLGDEFAFLVGHILEVGSDARMN
jgi:hypothetical protein